MRLVAAAMVVSLVGLTAGLARAVGGDDHVTLGRLDIGAGGTSRLSGLRRLAWEIDKRTSVDISADAQPVTLASEDRLRNVPLLWLSTETPIPATIADVELERLRRHLQSGGTLIIDNTEGRAGAVDQSVRAFLKRLFPRQRLETVPPEHVIQKSFYLITAPVGRVAFGGSLEAIFFDGRAAVIYSPNDVLGAIARDALGQWEQPVEPGGERQREIATRVGINLVLYVLCLDYKEDQVHVPFILRRRPVQP